MSDNLKERFMKEYELSSDDLDKVSGGNSNSHPTECVKGHGFYFGDSCPICTQSRHSDFQHNFPTF